MRERTDASDEQDFLRGPVDSAGAEAISRMSEELIMPMAGAWEGPVESRHVREWRRKRLESLNQRPEILWPRNLLAARYWGSTGLRFARQSHCRPGAMWRKGERENFLAQFALG